MAIRVDYKQDLEHLVLCILESGTDADEIKEIIDDLACEIGGGQPMTNHPPDEPLTCSEVVERLRQECFLPEREYYAAFDTRKAESILHSWRERRVQELEMVIARAAFFVSFTKAALRERGDLEGLSKVHVWEQDAEKLLKSDEWREQIRKGAKHE